MEGVCAGGRREEGRTKGKRNGVRTRKRALRKLKGGTAVLLCLKRQFAGLRYGLYITAQLVRVVGDSSLAIAPLCSAGPRARERGLSVGLTGETTNVVPSDGLNVLSSITSEFDEIVSDLSMLFLEVCFFRSHENYHLHRNNKFVDWHDFSRCKK